MPRRNAMGLFALWIPLLIQSALVPTAAVSQTSNQAVACLGRLVPGEKLLRITGPYSRQGPSLVKELLVKRGERVQSGQLLARLQHHDVALAEARQMEAELKVAERELDRVRAGEKAGTIAAQEALALRHEAELANAQRVFQRQEQLFKDNAISPNEFDRAALDRDIARKSLDQAQSQLAGLKEIRDVDLRVAEARVAAAQASLDRARAELELAQVRAPIDGTILDILTLPGEALDQNPLLYLGDTDRMRVEAEVYVSDIRHVRAGAAAKIRGEGFDGELKGKVVEKGWQVSASNLFDPDPAAFSDRRVVKVWIELEEGGRVQALVNHQVSVVISP